MTVCAQSAMSPSHSARVAEAMALSDLAFRKRYRSSYETPSPSSSPTLPVRKRYRGTSALILDTDSEGDELGNEDTKEDVEDKTANEPLGLGYVAARSCALESTEEIAPNPEDGRVYTDILTYVPPTAPVQTLPSPEWSLATISVDEDQFLEAGAQLELHGSILHDHTQRLDVLPLRILIGMFRSYEQEQERAIVTFGALWRPVLALEAWAGHVDAWMTDMSHARYDDHKLIHDMLVQQAAMQRELQEMRGRVTTLEYERVVESHKWYEII
ncbi:hypothetical protein Tco_1099832 [Tanacetum coccineum]